MPLRTSPLDSAHRELGAKMVPFGGWDMPLNYPAGTLAEHRCCRSAAVAFDVSHLGTVRVVGPGAHDALQRALSNDLGRIGPGRAQYTHLLSETGGVDDDIIIWWRAPDVFDVMPNASNTDRVVEALSATDAEVTDVTAERAVIAVQGPTARNLLAAVFPAAAGVGRFRVADLDFDGTTCVVAGTGYTGEDGVEIAVPVETGPALWRAIIGSGVEPAGLGARDTLRLEAALPLHGHELTPDLGPLHAGLEWVVAWDKGDFRGKPALMRLRDEGVDHRLRGLTVAGRRPPRADQRIRVGDTEVGWVTSGNFSPILDHGIALAYLPPDTAVGDSVTIDARGTAMAARGGRGAVPQLAEPAPHSGVVYVGGDSSVDDERLARS